MNETDRELQPKCYRIGVLGGTFDPVHNGHIALAKAAIAAGALNRLLIMPAHIQPFKVGKEIAADADRFAMLRLAFAEIAQAEVSDYELAHTSVSYTYDTLQYLQAEQPESRFYFVMGTDAFLSLAHWYKGIDLLTHFSFIVSSRPGYKKKDLQETMIQYRTAYHAETILLDACMPDVSSTQVREALRNGLPVNEMISPEVERYIHEYGLYR